MFQTSIYAHYFVPLLAVLCYFTHLLPIVCEAEAKRMIFLEHLSHFRKGSSNKNDVYNKMVNDP